MLSTALVLGGVASAQKVAFEEYDLDNGMHVILHNDPSAPVVVTSVMYHVGSKDETPDRTGFAHFFEHLLFEGTENIKRGEWFKIVTSNGGTNNASLSVTAAQVVYTDGTKLVSLANGSSGEFLKSNGTTASWATQSYNTIMSNGSGFTQRPQVNFIGAVVEDDLTNNRTNVTINSGSLTGFALMRYVTDITGISFVEGI